MRGIGLAFVVSVVGACQLTPDPITSREVALDAVRAALEFPYRHAPVDVTATPDRRIVELTAEAVTTAPGSPIIKVAESAQASQALLRVRFRDVAGVTLTPEEGFPGEQRVTIVLTARDHTPSARALTEAGDRTGGVLSGGPALRLPGRSRSLAARFREAVLWLRAQPDQTTVSEVARRDPEHAVAPVTSPNETPASAGLEKEGARLLSTRLRDLKRCLQEGLITNEEFEAKRRALIEGY